MHKEKIRTHAILGRKSRIKKAKKILAVLSDCVDITDKIILDIGIGSGHITHELGKKVKKAYGTDIIDQRKITSGYRWKKMEKSLPFPDASMDIVISNHVIEHVADQKHHLSEIWRVLKPGGYCYLATPNRYWMMEPHYRLLFLGWLPRKAAAFYLKKMKNAEYDLSLLSFAKLKMLIRRWKVRDFTLEIMAHPKRYGADDIIFSGYSAMVKKIPKRAARLLSYVVPAWVMVLRKK